jgi:hypothetical protein
MRNTLLAILFAVLPASIAAAEQPFIPKPDQSATTGKLLPLKGPGTVNSCAAYGPGFVRVEGTNTCMLIGGAVTLGARSSSGGR